MPNLFDLAREEPDDRQAGRLLILADSDSTSPSCRAQLACRSDRGAWRAAARRSRPIRDPATVFAKPQLRELGRVATKAVRHRGAVKRSVRSSGWLRLYNGFKNLTRRGAVWPRLRLVVRILGKENGASRQRKRRSVWSKHRKPSAGSGCSPRRSPQWRPSRRPSRMLAPAAARSPH